MSWFDSSKVTSFAKSALSNAQKSIDRVLDIQEEERAKQQKLLAALASQNKTGVHATEPAVTVSINSTVESPDKDQVVAAPVEKLDDPKNDNKNEDDHKNIDGCDEDEQDNKSGRRSNVPETIESSSLSRSTRTSKSQVLSGDGESFWGAFLTGSEEDKRLEKKYGKPQLSASSVPRKVELSTKRLGGVTSMNKTKKTELQIDNSSEHVSDVPVKGRDSNVQNVDTNVDKNIEQSLNKKSVIKSENEYEGSPKEDEILRKSTELEDDEKIAEDMCQSKESTDSSKDSTDGFVKVDDKESFDEAAIKTSADEISTEESVQKTDLSDDEVVMVARNVVGTDDSMKPSKTEGGMRGEERTKKEVEMEKHDKVDIKEQVHEGDSKSEYSSEGHVTDDQSSFRSDSDFVVISDLNGSAPSSTNVSRSSPESSSPRHYPLCQGNGKQSPSDSDFSIISEEKAQENVQFDASSNTDIPAMLADASLNLSQRTSPTDTTGSEVHKYSSSGEEGSLKESADDEYEDGDGDVEVQVDELDKTLTETAMKSEMCHEDTMTASLEDSSASVESVKEVESATNENVHVEDDNLPESVTDIKVEQVTDAKVDNNTKNTEERTFNPEDAVQAEKLLKEANKTTNDDDDKLLSDKSQECNRLHEKLAEMAEVLLARENQILNLSKQKMALEEDNTIVRNQLQQSEAAREAELEDLNTVSEEFTDRLSNMERKLQLTQKERDTLKREIQIAQQQLVAKSQDDELTLLLAEKDEQIQGLMEEGEKLSKLQLQNSNIIKKLRVKEKESDNLIKSLKKQLDTAETELDHLREVLDGKEDIDKQQKDSIAKLNAAVEKQEKQINSFNSEMEDTREKIRSTQSALDASYKEIAELHKTIAAKESNLQEAQLSAQMGAKEEIRLALERAQQESRYEQESLAMQVNDLRMSLTRAEQQYARKEDNLRQEILDLQERLQEAEYRNQELSQSVSAATKPLLRQIENLQSTFSTQSNSWERVERSLTERLNEAQTQLVLAQEKERMVMENSMEMNSRLASLESQTTMLRQEKSRFTALLEMERAKVEGLEDHKNKETAQLDSVRHTYSKAIEDLQRDKELLEKQLDMERLRVETEKKKLILAHDALKEKEKKLEEITLHNLKSRSTTPEISRNNSFTNETLTLSAASTPIVPSTPTTQGELLEYSMMSSSMTGSMYESVASGSATTIIESLQSQLNRKDGVISQLQVEISQLERTRASMAEELVNLSNRNEILEDDVGQIPYLKEQIEVLDRKHNAVLQMYGEKLEESQELRLDLQDVKEMYRQQIQELLKAQ